MLGARFFAQSCARNFSMCMDLFPRARLAFLSLKLGLSPLPPGRTHTHNTHTKHTHTRHPQTHLEQEDSESRSVPQRDLIPRKHSCTSVTRAHEGGPLLTLLLLGRVLHPEWPSCRGASSSPAAPLACRVPRGSCLAPWGRRALWWRPASPALGAGGGGPVRWVHPLSTLPY